MTDADVDVTDEESEDAEVHEVFVKQISETSIAVKAEDRKQAFEALRDVNKPEEVSRVLTQADYDFVERRPEDARRAHEYEDNDDLEPDVDVTDYTGEHNPDYDPGE